MTSQHLTCPHCGDVVLVKISPLHGFHCDVILPSRRQSREHVSDVTVGGHMLNLVVVDVTQLYCDVAVEFFVMCEINRDGCERGCDVSVAPFQLFCRKLK